MLFPEDDYQVSYKSKYKKAFDLFTMILSLYNAFQIPLELSFFPVDHDGIRPIDIIIDFVFLIDILLMFRTTQQGKRGYEETDNYEIFKIYTSTWRFRFDFLAMLGNQIFTQLFHYFKFFKVFKASRVFRVAILISMS